MTESNIAYIGILNNKNEPLLLNNYTKSKYEELNFQMNVFCASDIIDDKIIKKLTDRSENPPPINSYLGFLTSVYLSDNEYDIYGFITVTKLKMVLILG